MLFKQLSLMYFSNSWLRWICKGNILSLMSLVMSNIFSAPTPVPGIVQGVLPPLLLTILFIILPYILRGVLIAVCRWTSPNFEMFCRPCLV
jgi:hypothetical protein